MPENESYVLGNYAQSLRVYAIAINSIGAGISLGMSIFGTVLVFRQRSMWKNGIFRIVFVVQPINCARLISRVVITCVPLTSHAGCRIMAFLNYALGILPVYLCVHCNLYLQLVVIHHVSPHRRFPRVASLTLGTLMAVVPQTLYLYLPPRQMGLQDYCHIPMIPTWHRLIIIIVTYDIFIFLPGVIGVISMSITGIYMVHTARRIKRVSRCMMLGSRTAHLVEINGNSDLLRKTIKAVVWFPIAPIVSTWFNGILPIVRYYTGRQYQELEFINIALFALMAVIHALAMLMNPCVRQYFHNQRLERHRPK